MLRIESLIQEKIFESGVPTSNRHDMAVRSLHRHSNREPNLCDVKDLCDGAESGDRGAILALLLFFVPNLKALRLAEFSWDTAPSLKRVILSMAEPNPRTRKPLMDLSDVHLEGAEESAKGENFEALISFATLPSMRTITGDFVEGRIDQMVNWVFPPRSSNITEIVLVDSQVKADLLAQMLIGIKALKRFTYEHRDYNGDNPEGRMMESHNIIGTLLEHAKHSLKYLSLTGRSDMQFSPDDIHPGRGSLRDFKVLKEVVIESQIYVEEHGSIDFVLDTGSTQKLTRLVNELPPSIESLTLVGHFVLDHAPHLLYDLPKQKKQLLPKLEKLNILTMAQRPNSAVVKQLKREYEKVGVTARVVF